ncbi:MAG TPA: hypothetical protein DHW49_03480 [Anaerolineae bacterium]|nr:hypothetical protein [Anaerolineae bacterium]
MQKYIFTLLILLALSISACGSQEITHTAPELTDNWSVRMIQTGGIAGVNRAVEVLSDGSYTVYPQAGAEGIKGQLTEAELNQLTDLITNLEIKSIQTNSVCADCFEYNIEIQSGGRKMVLDFDDITLPDSGAGELVSFLSGLMQ